jgi:ubiquinone/menaquinone biosynthesis C-methylase UbiE
MATPRVTQSILTRQQAREFYDRLGARRDGHPFYARRAIRRLVEHGEFESASSVVEFGCGAGALAAQLMEHVLPTYATYTAFDLSETMVQNTRRRLVTFGARVTITQTDGRPRIPLPPRCCDRFVSTYVLDLLPGPDIAKLLSQAWTLLRPDGLLCLTSLTFGRTPMSKLAIAIWQRVHARWPEKVGGSRPIALSSYLGPASWKIVHSSTSVSRGVPSEIVIARPRGHGATNDDAGPALAR